MSAGLTCLALIACEPRSPGADSASGDTVGVRVIPPTGTESLDVNFEYARQAPEYAAEATAIGSAPPRVHRSRGLLLIVGRNGDTLSLRDDIAPGDAYVRYVYERFDPRLDAHLVRAGFYEGSSVLFVADSTAAKKDLDESPIVSPDGRRFAVASLDLEAGYEPNLLEIWNPGTTMATPEFTHDFGQAAGPDSVAWVSNDTLRFVFTQYTAGGTYERSGRTVVRSGERWMVEPALPAAPPQ